jgi:hypothetical protein
MQIYFATRDKARSATFGKMVDNGPDAPKGRRFARDISNVSGNAAQRRKTIRAVVTRYGIAA